MATSHNSSETARSETSMSNPIIATERSNKLFNSMKPTTSIENELENDNINEKTPIDMEKQQLNAEDKNIDRGYAWVICFASFLLNFSTWGMNSGFAIYFSYYLNHDTFPEASKMDYSYIGGIAFGVGLFCAPAINFLQGKVGTIPMLIFGNCLQFTGLMLASWSRKLWELYLTQGLMQSFGLAIVSIPATTLLPQYFKKKRVLAGGLATAGSGVGGICFNLGMQRVVDSRGVFWALRTQSIIGFGISWIAISLVRTKSTHKIDFTFYDKQVLKTAAFWLLSFFVVTCMFGYVIVLYTLDQFTTSLGYSEHQGSIVSAMVQLGSCCGRPIVGLLSDKFGGATVSMVAYTISGIFCLAMWIPARNFATVIVFALIMGATMGSIYGMIAPVIARTFGLKKMNVAFSMVWMIMGVAGIFSPVIGVKLKRGGGGFVDPTQYVDCSIFAGCAFLACAASLLLLRGYIKARDHLLGTSEDSDSGDFTGVAVPFSRVFTSCFDKSHEKT
ncbi:monocarboxylate transporter [Scheffersomyces xylosifermentans]|uniref:monocarboxylate transporter n=1 Tax=Scheffersomyces xylosifermentans TaxID=1304137 RepID=UPI00315DDB0F